MTWQGETVTGPLLIFHSEIQQTVNSNSLTCRHPTGPVAWYLAVRNTRLTTEPSATFINAISNDGRQAQLRRGANDRQESQFDGLWTCRLNGATGAGAFHVGIYDDTPPTSKITLNHFLFRLTSHSKILRVFWVFKISLLLPHLCMLVHIIRTLQNDHVTDIQHNHLYIAHKKKCYPTSELPSITT